jgi:hypothetical protein
VERVERPRSQRIVVGKSVPEVALKAEDIKRQHKDRFYITTL